MDKKIIGIIFMFLVPTFILGCISESPSPNNIIPVWTKIFDGAVSFGFANQTSDGGYIMIANLQLSTVGNSYQSALKTDKNGNELWNKTFGGGIGSIEQTSDGGYILAGSTRLYGKGNENAWLIKTDKDGNVQWNRTFGGSASSAQQTSDGGYIISGSTTDSSAENRIIKTDSNGSMIWDKILEGPSRTETDANSIRQVSDGGYIIAGARTESYGFGFGDNFRRRALLLKIQ